MFGIKKIKALKNKPVLADILDLAAFCLVIIIVARLFTSFIILTGYVPSGSMEPRIMTHDRIIANRMAYWINEPGRGHIVVFHAPDERATTGEIRYYVKRIIGLPGESVLIYDGRVYIDDDLLDEYYLMEGVETFDNSGRQPYLVPENHFFVLGDNRGDSHDSRFWANTQFVPREYIRGRVFVKYSLRLSNLHIRTVG